MQIHLQQQVPASQTASICHLPHPPRRRAVSKQREASQSRLRALAGSAAPVSDKEQENERENGVVSASSHDGDRVEFKWFQQWYPVLPVSYLDQDKPNKYRVLGLDVVLWPDQDGKWRAAKDVCPHRLAALSEGWLESGQLQCRYHGWTYNTSGQCVACPQASPELEHKLTQGERGNLQTYPTLEHHGMLWVWPSSNPEAWIESYANPPPTDPELQDPSWISAGSEWDFVEQPVSWQTLVENAFDPTHGTFLHEGVLGNKKNAAPISMSVHQQPTIHGFQVNHDGFTKQQKDDPLDGSRLFRPPGCIRMLYTQHSGKQTLAIIYFVPVSAGVTRLFTKICFRSGDGKGTRGSVLINRLAKLAESSGLLHVFGGGIVDQDAFMLNSQEVATARAGKKQRAYRLATPADTGVATFWRWLDLVGGIPYADGRSMFDLRPRTRAQLLDRWNRHTKLCPICQKALKRVDLARQACVLAAGAALALAVLRQGQALPALGLAAAAVGCRALLGQLRLGFFTASKPPGSQWHEAPPPPAVEWLE